MLTTELFVKPERGKWPGVWKGTKRLVNWGDYLIHEKRNRWECTNYRYFSP